MDTSAARWRKLARGGDRVFARRAGGAQPAPVRVA
eukprot:CAMPEP_0202035976 /NCGR_PEP_ID=MMETSP0962-20130828/1258_1 /ASSEMBLY_ACC=CAM_ASM_000488 /TAXON_ID=4773 /ORGANISM="Schizochytrium aggregatum, Strain ATCC28209" /LENGTH=34 /DNA_ID= /DNA_START= /DNA_END= /DNA_ORIENTATION=